MSRQFVFAFVFSVILHASLLLVQCQGKVEPIESTEMIELVEDAPEIPEVQAPVESPSSQQPPPPPPPIPVQDPPPQDPPPPDIPTEQVQKVDTLPLQKTPPPEPVIERVSNEPTKPNPQTTPSAGNTPGKGSGSGNGDSEAIPTLGTAQLDNTDFKPYGNAKPSYPEVARKLGIEGEVILDLVISPDGKVLSIQVVQTTGHASFADAAAATARNWRFAPPRYQGKPVKARYRRSIGFRLR